MPKVDEPNDRLRDEIENILEAEEKKDSKRPVEPFVVGKRPTPRRVRTGTPIWMPTPEKLIVLGIVILLVGALTRTFLLPLVIVGFSLAGFGYYMMVRRGRAAKYGKSPSRSTSGGMEPKYWRGRPVSPPKSKTPDGKVVEFPDTVSNKVRRRFGKKR